MERYPGVVVRTAGREIRGRGGLYSVVDQIYQGPGRPARRRARRVAVYPAEHLLQYGKRCGCRLWNRQCLVFPAHAEDSERGVPMDLPGRYGAGAGNNLYRFHDDGLRRFGLVEPSCGFDLPGQGARQDSAKLVHQSHFEREGSPCLPLHGGKPHGDGFLRHRKRWHGLCLPALPSGRNANGAREDRRC